ncbi:MULTISPECIES: hypothetical protein [Avibacterium]|uniref:Uncharacterized protein n=1 Tax=Avibacterium paragallinarum TaxID=728 RepID=A0ABU7QPQ3_AVIPA|nr:MULTISPECIES: hypothetical protein [Avibacterium]MCW9715195.1 hypothetical protein [Avibacterium sp. 21-594]
MYSANARFETYQQPAQQGTFAVSPYTDSEVQAIIAGYTECADARAYNGRYFIKNGLKWIHNLEALRRKLNNEYGRYIDDEELRAEFGYDVENYYARHQNLRLQRDPAFRRLMAQIKVH